jgi:hypothetical protein
VIAALVVIALILGVVIGAALAIYATIVVAAWYFADSDPEAAP